MPNKNFDHRWQARWGTEIGFAIGSVMLPGICLVPLMLVIMFVKFHFLLRVLAVIVVVAQVGISIWVGMKAYRWLIKEPSISEINKVESMQDEYIARMDRQQPTRAFFASLFLAIASLAFFMLLSSERMSAAMHEDFPEGVPKFLVHLIPV